MQGFSDGKNMQGILVSYQHHRGKLEGVLRDAKTNLFGPRLVLQR